MTHHTMPPRNPNDDDDEEDDDETAIAKKTSNRRSYANLTKTNEHPALTGQNSPNVNRLSEDVPQRRRVREAPHRRSDLIIWGNADRIIVPAYAQEFAMRIAGARIELIKKAGHLPYLEQPDAVAKVVRGFLGRT